MFMDDHRGDYGVEAICRVLPIAPSTYHHHQAVKRDPSKASLRAQSDAELCPKIVERWEASGKRYGAVKVWHDLNQTEFTGDVRVRHSAAILAESSVL